MQENQFDKHQNEWHGRTLPHFVKLSQNICNLQNCTRSKYIHIHRICTVEYYGVIYVYDHGGL